MRMLSVEQKEAIERLERMDEIKKEQQKMLKVFSGWKMSVFYVSEMITMVGMILLFQHAQDAISVVQGMVTCGSVVVFIVLYYRPVHFSLLFFVFLRIWIWVWYVIFILFSHEYNEIRNKHVQSLLCTSCVIEPMTLFIYARRILLYDPMVME